MPRGVSISSLPSFFFYLVHLLSNSSLFFSFRRRGLLLYAPMIQFQFFSSDRLISTQVLFFGSFFFPLSIYICVYFYEGFFSPPSSSSLALITIALQFFFSFTWGMAQVVRLVSGGRWIIRWMYGVSSVGWVVNSCWSCNKLWLMARPNRLMGQ